MAVMLETQSLDELVATEVRAELGRQSMSKAELARQLDQTWKWVDRRLTGEVAFTFGELQMVASVLDVSVMDLMRTTHEEMDRRGMDRGLAASLGGRTEAIEPKVPRQRPQDQPDGTQLEL